MRAATFFLWLALCGFCVGQDAPPDVVPGVIAEPIRIICPEVIPDRSLADIRVETEAKTVTLVVFRATGTLDEDVTLTATREARAPNTWSFSSAPGLYRIMAYGYVGEKVEVDLAELRVGPEVPLPPDPIDPVNPVVTAGTRLVFLIHETKDQTPTLARLIGNLRSGEHEKYLREKKHNFLNLDDDETAAQVQPWIKAARAAVPTGAVLVIVDPLQIGASSAGVLFAGKCPDDATGKAVIDLIKQYGG